jgi:hypothetical protein
MAWTGATLLFTLTLTVISLQTGTGLRPRTKQTHHTIRIRTHYWVTAKSADLAVTCDITSVSYTYFSNSVLHLIITWHINTETKNSQDRRLLNTVRAAATRIWRSVSYTELKPRNGLFMSCGWLQVHRFDFFLRFFSLSLSPPPPQKYITKRTRKRSKSSSLTRRFCPDGRSVRCPELKVLPTQSATDDLTLNPSVGHYKFVLVLNKTPNNGSTWGSGSKAPRILNISTRWSECQFHGRPLYLQAKNPQYPLDRRLGERQRLSGLHVERTNIFFGTF